MNLFDVLARLDGAYLAFHPFAKAMSEIDGLLELYRQTGKARNLVVQGESGTGKTTLCKTLVHKYPRKSMSDRDLIPVLHIEVPSDATIGATLETILEILGDPDPFTGTNHKKESRVLKLAKGRGVELLLIDEGQQIHDRGKDATRYKVGDFLKMLVDHMSIPTVLLGLPRTDLLLRVNDQLRRRFTRRVAMSIGQNTSVSPHAECLQLFTSLSSVLPAPLGLDGYDMEEMGRRFYTATDGRIGYVKLLLESAVKLAFEQELKEITPAVLHAAFTNGIWDAGIGALNPFDERFEFRSLDRVGEPFERVFATASRRGRQADARL
jgi:GTPase SAR1 family protein